MWFWPCWIIPRGAGAEGEGGGPEGGHVEVREGVPDPQEDPEGGGDREGAQWELVAHGGRVQEAHGGPAGGEPGRVHEEAIEVLQGPLFISSFDHNKQKIELINMYRAFF